MHLRVEAVEAALRRSLTECAEDEPNGVELVGRRLAELTAGLDASQRQELRRRFVHRNPAWFSASAQPSVAEPPAGAAEKANGASARVATLERQVRDLRAENEELRRSSGTASADLGDASQQLAQQNSELRKLRKQYEQLQRQSSDSQRELQVKAELLHSQERTMLEMRAAFDRQGKLLIERDTEVKRLTSELRGRPEPQAAKEAPAAAAVPPPVQPPAVISVAWETLQEGLKEAGEVTAAEYVACSREQDARMARVMVELMAFQRQVEKNVIAQLDALAHRHTILKQYRDDLQHFRRTGKMCWWSLTYPAAGRNDPVRHFGLYLSEVRKLNSMLLSAYYTIVSTGVKEKARQSLAPTAIERRAGKSHPSDLWGYYRDTACNDVPNELSDACEKELVSTMQRLFEQGGA